MKRFLLFTLLFLANFARADDETSFGGVIGQDDSALSESLAPAGFNPVWRCDAWPALGVGLSTFWVHASPYVACQNAVSTCQAYNGVPCYYRYYRVN